VYDVIVSEPSNPWVIGVEMLYSREFLEAARERLAPGGVYAQWFHAYETSSEVVELVLRTYTSVFPHISVWYTQGADMLLLGFNRVDWALDVEALEERFAGDDYAAAFARVGIENFAQFAAHELVPLGAINALEQPGEVHTLRHPLLSYEAAHAFFRGRMGSLTPFQNRAQERIAVRNSLLRRHAKGQTPLPEEIVLAAAQESCRFNQNQHCGTFFALWSLLYPRSPMLKGALRAQRMQGSEAARRYVAPQSLNELKFLLGGSEAEPGKIYSAAEAEQLTGQFRRHYHHVVPFRRARLDQVWDRCSEADCEERRIRAEAGIGIPHGQSDARGAAVPNAEAPSE
jgi:hypothetical protein